MSTSDEVGARVAVQRKAVSRELWTVLSDIKELTSRAWGLAEKLCSLPADAGQCGESINGDGRAPRCFAELAGRDGGCQVKCESCGHWNECPRCNGWICEHCGADLSAGSRSGKEALDGARS